MTFNTAIEEMLEKFDIDTDEVKELIDVTNYDIDTLELIKQDLNTIMDVIPEAREKVLGKEKYHKQGSTVIYSFDSFEIDFLGWRKYYKGEAGRPADVCHKEDLGQERTVMNQFGYHESSVSAVSMTDRKASCFKRCRCRWQDRR